jgi:hypothetical protein
MLSRFDPTISKANGTSGEFCLNALPRYFVEQVKVVKLAKVARKKIDPGQLLVKPHLLVVRELEYQNASELSWFDDPVTSLAVAATVSTEFVTELSDLDLMPLHGLPMAARDNFDRVSLLSHFSGIKEKSSGICREVLTRLSF